MFHLKAGHPAVTGIIRMPEPNMGDGLRPQARVLMKQAMDGSVRTHIKKQDSAREYRFDFELTRLKAIELYEWTNLFTGEQIYVERDNEHDFIGFLKVNPLSLDMASRGVVANSTETVRVS